MKVFTRVEFRLMVVYAVLLVAVLVAVDSFIDYSRTVAVQQSVAREVSPALAAELNGVVARTVNNLRILNYTFYGLIVLFVGGVGYLLTRHMLKPIDDMLQSQQRFLANAAHELRTPLTLLRTETELSLRDVDNLSREQLVQTIENVSQESIKMADIINNLLLVSSASAGKHAIPFVEVNFSEAVTRALNNCVELAKKQNISLQSSIEPRADVQGNVVALEQVATNLIRNAIIHTPAPGTVTVSLKKSRRSATLDVEDTGVGIRKEELPHIFEPFFKGTLKHAGQRQGTGLGLPIVKQLVEMHKGTIIVSSEPHKGTHFRVTVPLA